jgi:hypothetical protein
MSTRALVAAAILLVSSTAHAEGEPPAAAPAPLAMAPAPTRLPPGFMDNFLTYDDTRGEITVGRDRRPISRDEAYVRMNRPDLVEKSRLAKRRRLILAISAGGVLATGVAVGVIARVGMPYLNSRFCVQNAHNYNEVCIPEIARREVVSAAGLIAGFGIGAVLGGLAYWSNPSSILSFSEMEKLVAIHNAALLKRLRSNESGVRLTPHVSPQGGGATVSLRF